MRNEAIFLASLLVLVVALMVPIGQGAVDIFSGMDAGDGGKTKQPESEKVDPEEGMQTCMTDVHSEDSIKFDKKLLALPDVGKAIKEMPNPPPSPDFNQILSRFHSIFQLPRFSEMGEVLKAMIDEMRAKVDVYVKQWMGVFRKHHRQAVDKAKATVQKMNRKISGFFANNFKEFKDVCLPDTNQCLQSIQKNLEDYDKRLNKNMAACKEFAKRQVDQHNQWVKNEGKQLEQGPFLRVAGCFKEGLVGPSLASCVGNMVSNMMKAVTDGMKRFSNAMERASSSLQNRMGKFQECVVNRKELLDRSKKRIADRAKDCLRKQPIGDEEMFGGF